MDVSTADKVTIKCNVDELRKDCDPLGEISNELQICEWIENLNLPTGIFRDIVSYAGYTESTLNRPSYIAYSSVDVDCELCFLLSMPYNSKYDYQYTLHSFKTHIYGRESDKIQFIIVKLNENEQGSDFEEIHKSDIIQCKDGSLNKLPNEYQINPDDVFGFRGEIIEFNDLNIKLSNNQTYIMRIDVIDGCIDSGALQKKLQDCDKHLLCDTATYRDKTYDNHPKDTGKPYELVLY